MGNNSISSCRSCCQRQVLDVTPKEGCVLAKIEDDDYKDLFTQHHLKGTKHTHILLVREGKDKGKGVRTGFFFCDCNLLAMWYQACSVCTISKKKLTNESYHRALGAIVTLTPWVSGIKKKMFEWNLRGCIMVELGWLPVFFGPSCLF